MSLFSKRKRETSDADVSAGIDEFWRWWDGAAGELAEAVPAGRLAEHVDAVSERVAAIHPELAWEFGQGIHSEHQLTVTAGGDPPLRRIARRWLRSAPPSDRTWSFYDLRLPGPLDAVLSIGGAEVAFADVLVVAEQRATGLDVTVHHPVFASVPVDARGQIAFLCLDTALGEEATELWIGEIDWSVGDPDGSRSLAELPAMLAVVTQEFARDGKMGWFLAEAWTPHGPMLVRCLNRLSPVQAPDLDQHVAITAEFRAATSAGMPGPDDENDLANLESSLHAVMEEGAGQIVAVQTGGGRRTFHCYVDSTTSGADELKKAARGSAGARVRVRARLDPSWEAVRPFRV
ncbi:DUF695 domain-containing protein [Antribacter sp. KLBMP9083]|uniref:DUF695 domain-containing protein n=1 Tax=Antribacter soli TaxID=2910976 RepID=A0AA41QDZ9_9MICO|nr:DUF695 domain-containing protein [Antribacter soli]MCF4121698.1 DUF695 domain-containing protein [Antribacter soli]